MGGTERGFGKNGSAEVPETEAGLTTSLAAQLESALLMTSEAQMAAGGSPARRVRVIRSPVSTRIDIDAPDIEAGEYAPMISVLSLDPDGVALCLERHMGSDGRFPIRSRCGWAMPRTSSVPFATT